MNARRTGVYVLLIHLGLVCAVAAKYALDMQVLPRAWAHAQMTYESQGKYVVLTLCPESIPAGSQGQVPVRLSVSNGRLIALPGLPTGRLQVFRATGCLTQSVTYYLPDNIPVPKSGTRVDLEVIVPTEEMPRPLRIKL